MNPINSQSLTVLSPTQEKALQQLEELLPCGSVFLLKLDTGLGKSTILSEFQNRLGGKMLTLKDVLDAQQGRHPLAIEDGILELLMDAVRQHGIVILDDLHTITRVVSGFTDWPRCDWIDAVLHAVCTYAAEAGKKLIFAHDQNCLPGPIHERCYCIGFDGFTIEDYRAMCAAYLDEEPVLRLDFEKIHRFAPEMNGHLIRNACEILRRDPDLNTEAFIKHLLDSQLASNVDLAEVEQVDLADLRGVDHILRALETHVVIPFEHDDLATELCLRPKKGVLLYGPPGTGKTTIGRALAHRLKGKFFLIDGTFISGGDGFHRRVNHIFQAASRNAPSIIFIDDSDVVCDEDDGAGFYR